MASLPNTDLPLVQSPMAGGGTTPDLVAAVVDAGGLGFVAAGYLSARDLHEQVEAVRERTSGPFGVNLFVPWPDRVDPATLGRYAETLEPDARRLSTALGTPHWDDDGWPAKVDLLLADPVPVVSLTFGCPMGAIPAFHDVGSAVAVTVTTPAEAIAATTAGADALLLQGSEAGAHRGSWTPDADPVPLATLLAIVRGSTDLPLVAAGGIATADDVREVLANGATFAQVGTALLRSPESGVSQLHKDALAGTTRPTTLTRAFTGRRARGLVNGFIREHADAEIDAYPHVHHLTKPLRTAAARAGDIDRMALWAGENHALAQDAPAATIIRSLAP